VAKANERLFGMSQKMSVERANLEGQPATRDTLDLLKAARVLNLPSYERYKGKRQRAFKNYRLNPSYVDPTTQQTCHAVFSTQYPDAPPRLFADISSRCRCQERLAEEDMCPHEILVNDGFNEDYFLPRHMAREFVSGSLDGWTESVAGEQSNIDNILGYEMEQMAPSSKMDGVIGTADGDTMAYDAMMTDAAQQPTHESLPTHESASTHASAPTHNLVPPPGYIPQTGGTIQPLGKKHVQRSFANATAAYATLSKERKFQVCELVMQLDNLLLGDSTKSSVVETRGGLTVHVPNQSILATEPKKRMMTKREISVKKMKRSLQNQGESQSLHVNEQYDIMINGKQRGHCGFCDNNNHKITSCDLRQERKARGFEYMLSTTLPLNESVLRTRITKGMPLVEAGKGSLLGAVAREHTNSNFIIHKASLVEGGTSGCMDNMIFCISFLGRLGTVVAKDIWITGGVMNTPVSYTHLRAHET